MLLRLGRVLVTTVLLATSCYLIPHVECTASAAPAVKQTIKGRIVANHILKDMAMITRAAPLPVDATLLAKSTSAYAPAGNTARVSLDGDKFVTFVDTEGKFTIEDVPVGSYLCDITSSLFRFEQYRIQVEEDGVFVYHYQTGSNWALLGDRTGHPFDAEAIGEKHYFQPRESFSVFSIFQNPMMLMMGFSGVMMLFMPKLLESARSELEGEAKSPIESSDDLTHYFMHLNKKQ